MTRRHIAHPPNRALPPPSPYRMGRRGPQPVSRSCQNTWEQRTRRWMARSDSAPPLRLWLTHVSRALPPPPPAQIGPSQVSPMRCTPSRGSPPASSAWTSSWGASSTGRPRARTQGGGYQPCSAFPRASRYQGPRSSRPLVGGMARRPCSGGPPRVRCSWSRGGTTRRRAPGVTQSGTIRCLSRGDRSLAAPLYQHAAAGAVLASNSRVYAVWYAVMPAPSRPSYPRSTSTPAQGTTPPRGRGSRPAHSWGRGGSAARCRSLFTRPDPSVLAPGGRPLRLPWPSPLPAPPIAPLAPPGPRERPGAHSMYGRPMCRVIGTAIERPGAACEPQDRPSNQIKSNLRTPPPVPRRYGGGGTGGATLCRICLCMQFLCICPLVPLDRVIVPLGAQESGSPLHSQCPQPLLFADINAET